MRKVIFILLASLLLGAGSFYESEAQMKIGHINSNDLLMAMPERDSALSILESQRQSILRQSEELSVEYDRKLDAYLRQRDSLTPLVAQTKEDEITDFQERIRTFESAAQQELQNKQATLFQPIIDKAQSAIKAVAKENGFTYILDVGSGAVLYFPEEETYDILPLVKAKLGIL
jgi:outer membrane protein